MKFQPTAGLRKRFSKKGLKRKRTFSIRSVKVRRTNMISVSSNPEISDWDRRIGKKILIGLTDDEPVFCIERMPKNVFSK